MFVEVYTECVCVCVPSVPFAFVVLKEDLSDDAPAVLQQLRDLVATKIAKYAVPEHFLVSVCLNSPPHPSAGNRKYQKQQQTGRFT